MTAACWKDARRILCVRLDYLGDVLMSTPAIRALRQSAPGCSITLLTSASGAAVARHIPEIDDTIVYAAPWLKSGDAHDAAIDLGMIESLARRRFDAAVIFTVYSQNPLPAALLCHLAGIPLRLAHCRENPYRLLTHWVREPEPEEMVRHEVRRQLDLVATVGARTSDEGLSLRVPPQATARVRDRLVSMGIPCDAPWIVMHPGATASSRRYPPYLWRKAAQGLAETLGCPLVFTGGPGEVPLVDDIRRDIPLAISLAGRLELDELAALIAMAPVLVSNNTGPAHIAAAVGTPVVDLYALTNPQHTPWKVASRVLFQDVPCRYCYKSACPQGHHRCLAGVAPGDVVQATLSLLAGRHSAVAVGDEACALPPPAR